MTRFAATAVNIQKSSRRMSAARPTRVQSVQVERRVVINQPIEEVLDYVGSTSLGERLSGAGDPTFWQGVRLLGRQIEVCYTLYEVPGGTQITALARRGRSAFVDPLGTFATGSVLRKIDAHLGELKARME